MGLNIVVGQSSREISKGHREKSMHSMVSTKVRYCYIYLKRLLESENFWQKIRWGLVQSPKNSTFSFSLFGWMDVYRMYGSRE